MNRNEQIIFNETGEELKRKKELLYSLYINAEGSPEKMREIAKTHNLTLNLFVKYISSYINENIKKTNYAIVFDNLSLFNENDKTHIINYLKNTNLPITYLESNLIPYLINYKPEAFVYKCDKTLLSLSKKIHYYREYLMHNKDNKTNKINYTQEDLEKAINLITRFISSNYSKERFCIHEGISFQIFKNNVNIIEKDYKNNNSNLYEIYLKSLKVKEKYYQDNIENVVYDILNKIKNLGNNFCSIDLFKDNFFGTNEIIKKADEILSLEDIKLFRRYVSNYKKIIILNERSIEKLINDKITIFINNEEIEVENNVKLELCTYLHENNIPITLDSFRNSYLRYYQNKTKKVKSY